MSDGSEDVTWQRLDKWLWCARFMKARADCARLVSRGVVRLNRQPTDKPHAKLRPGDVLTIPFGPPDRPTVRVIEVLALATRRGPPIEARCLYRDVPEPGAQPPPTAASMTGDPCGGLDSSAYPDGLE